MPRGRSRRPEGGDLCAVFVHVGAGYHSVANEGLHLGAASDACKIAMGILKNGGEAVDAVEMAIRLLEDDAITNAGYGSNLTIEGHVECDATMVDHLGRSGAVGAVSQIRNPISLARLVLEATSKPLSLSRVPPNLLVGPGATDFAAEHGMPILPHDILVSDVSRQRWNQWRKELTNLAAHSQARNKFGTTQTIPVTQNGSVKYTSNVRSSRSAPQFSPVTDPYSIQPSNHSVIHGNNHEPLASKISPHAVPSTSYQNYAKLAADWHMHGGELETITDPTAQSWTQEAYDAANKRQRMDGSTAEDELSAEDDPIQTQSKAVPQSETDSPREDYITDTVGAIAVDCFGNIAAASSSGGIGMKHRGRCGPAALVGIGTAVIPVNPDDPDRVSVATVTSGTGEHMATTAAAATAADRIYSRVKRDRLKLKACHEDEAMTSMIKNDFMMHPGVRNQPCIGAIGVMSVKKTRDGIYCYFGHNTDSFAIATMDQYDDQPVCTMSRSKGNGSIAQGGRACRYKEPVQK